VGEIVNGIVKRNEFGNVTVDLGRAEGLMRRDESLPRESFRTGDRVRAYIYDVREEARGPQIFLSRSHPQFMAKLFAQEVPEIYDSIIEIKAVARDPGSRAKIAVISHDSAIDPVGACVGMRGSRVQAVVSELQGEKIDIIPWSPDTPTFVVNALAPAEVTKVVLDEEQGRIEVVVPDDQLSLAIGRRGQNVRLASQLSGWEIDILTEEEESRRRQEEIRTRSQMFMDALDVDDVIAHLLLAVRPSPGTGRNRRLRRGGRRGAAHARPDLPGRAGPQVRKGASRPRCGRRRGLARRLERGFFGHARPERDQDPGRSGRSGQRRTDRNSR
jgi:N utilization substance protein A